METNGSTIHAEVMTHYPTTEKKSIWTKDVKKGKYILRFSGTVSNSNGGFGLALVTNEKLNFHISAPGNKEEKIISFRNHSQPGYHYPFFMSEVFSCE